MSKRVRDILRRGQRGFTLIELVAVMAILAILVAIVAPAAINSERASITAQAQADSQSVRNAATSFFTQQNESEVRTPHSVILTTDINDDTNVAILSTTGVTKIEQMVSSRWPEVYITKDTGAPTLTDRTSASNPSRYHEVFPTGDARNAGGVVNVNLKDKNNADITGTALLGYTAIDLEKLSAMNLLRQMPEGVAQTSATGVTVKATSGGTATALNVPNFLWLFKKADSSLGGVGANDDRVVVVFTLVKVQQIEDGRTPVYVKLTYKQIVGP
ncbi:MAG: prepilin-type N-terminal cleavage/methylation domain-containing protein [Chloroflexota bacterium]